MHEIELKLVFENRELLKEKLLALGCDSIREELIEDLYFSNEVDSLKEAKRFLRIRKQDDFSEITFKGEEESGNEVSKRIEINSEISEPESMSEILERVGFRIIRKNKTSREYFDFGEIEVVIVEISEPVKLSHLEIEGPNERLVNDFREKLGDIVSDLPEDHFKEMDEV